MKKLMLAGFLATGMLNGAASERSGALVPAGHQNNLHRPLTINVSQIFQDQQTPVAIPRVPVRQRDASSINLMAGSVFTLV